MAMAASGMKNVLRHILPGREKRHYERRGYQVFRAAFPPEEIAAIADMARALVPDYAREIRRQDSTFAVNDFFPGTKVLRNSLLQAHVSLPKGLEPLSDKVRALVTSPALADRLRLLDGAMHYTVDQTLFFFAAQTTEIHIDSWSVDTLPLGDLHTVWIPLQDLNPRSGVPSVIPWPKGKVLTESELGIDQPHACRGDRYAIYHRALAERLSAASPEAVTPLLRKGDFIVWSSLTPHFTLPSFPFPIERLSLQVLIRPAHRPWGNFTDQATERAPDQLRRINERFSIRTDV
jgi:hypothetical protein